MLTICPHCLNKLKLSGDYQAKLNQALASLSEGKRLSIKCPHCKQSIFLDQVKDQANEQPDQAVKVSESEELSSAAGHAPPPPPDLEWLKESRPQDEEKGEDVPMALVLHPDHQARRSVIEAIELVGYKVITDESVKGAVDRMHFVDFACIVLHCRFEGGGLEDSAFHEYMRQMPMHQRRYIFYILIGPDFKTLYNMEALASSANLVVNDQDIKYMDVVLRKAIPAHEELFGPIMEELAAYGKR